MSFFTPSSSPENVQGPRQSGSMSSRALTTVQVAVLAALAACGADTGLPKVSDVTDLEGNPDCIETLNRRDVDVTSVLTGRDDTATGNPQRDIDIEMAAATKSNCIDYLTDLGEPDGVIVKVDGEVEEPAEGASDDVTTTTTYTLWADEMDYGSSSSDETSLAGVGVSLTLDDVSSNPVIGAVPWSYGNDDRPYGWGVMAITNIACPDLPAGVDADGECDFTVVDPEFTEIVTTN